MQDEYKLDYNLSYNLDEDIRQDELELQSDIEQEAIDKIQKQKQEEYRNKVKQLSVFNNKLASYLNPELKLGTHKEELDLYDFVTRTSSLLYSDLKQEQYDNLTRILDDQELIDSIADSKFHEYVQIRRNFHRLKIRIYNDEDITGKDHMFHPINATLKTIDEYIVSYLISYFILCFTFEENK